MGSPRGPSQGQGGPLSKCLTHGSFGRGTSLLAGPVACDQAPLLREKSRKLERRSLSPLSGPLSPQNRDGGPEQRAPAPWRWRSRSRWPRMSVKRLEAPGTNETLKATTLPTWGKGPRWSAGVVV